MKKTIGYVLSHTHWDREWYLSFQLFRMRLVDMLDTLIPYLEQHPEFPHFHLDGQTVCLEDYLEVRPDQAERRRHAGWISAGYLFSSGTDAADLRRVWLPRGCDLARKLR